MAREMPFEAAGVRGLLRALEPVGDDRHFKDRDVPFGALTAYAVFVDDERVGVVAKVETTTHRKAGRLITRTFHPKVWLAVLADYQRNGRTGEWSRGCGSGSASHVGYQHSTRGEATSALVRRWLELREQGV